MKRPKLYDSKGEELNEGDLVQLKSGGAKMIIRSLDFNAEYKKWYARCAWQDELNMPQQEDYPPTSLMKLFVS